MFVLGCVTCIRISGCKSSKGYCLWSHWCLVWAHWEGRGETASEKEEKSQEWNRLEHKDNLCFQEILPRWWFSHLWKHSNKKAIESCIRCGCIYRWGSYTFRVTALETRGKCGVSLIWMGTPKCGASLWDGGWQHRQCRILWKHNKGARSLLNINCRDEAGKTTKESLSARRWW